MMTKSILVLISRDSIIISQFHLYELNIRNFEKAFVASSKSKNPTKTCNQYSGVSVMRK